MLRKKVLTLMFIAGVLVICLNLAVAATTQPSISVSFSNVTSNSLTVTASNINAGEGNLLVPGSVTVYLATHSDPASSSANGRPVSDGGGSQTFEGLNPGALYYATATFSYRIPGNDVPQIAYASVRDQLTASSPAPLPGNLPTVETIRVDDYTSTQAEVRIYVSSQGDSSITERGIVYSTSDSNPTITSGTVRTVSGSGTGYSVVTLTGLSRNTRYYVRAFATNSQGTAYGEVEDFRTQSTSNEPEAITRRVEERAATSAEILIDTSGNDITERGVAYSERNTTPTISGSRNYTATAYGTTGEAVVFLSNLDTSTTYYARAYAINRHGTSYGEVISFTTRSSDSRPEVITVSASPISNTSMEVVIDVRRDNGSNITERGVVYSRSNINPRLDAGSSNSETISGRTGTGTVQIDRLSSNATYYVRAYARNGNGISYGAIMEVELGSNLVFTNQATNVTATSATVGGVAEYRSSSDIRDSGVVYSTSNRMPTESDTRATASTNNFGEFSVNLTGLTRNQTYYVRAYIRTNQGYQYGNAVEFTTSGTPTLTIRYLTTTGSQVSQQQLTLAAGQLVTAQNLTLPQGYTLASAFPSMVMPNSDDNVAVYVRFGSLYHVMTPNRPAGTVIYPNLSQNTLIFNGQPISFPAVAIDGNNWLKLRDIASILNNTIKQFSVDHDPVRNVGTLTSGRSYVPRGDEMAPLSAGPTAYASSLQFIVDGRDVSVAAYTIDGSNFLRLRDIAILFDFGFDWDGSTGIITLRLDRPYSE